MAHILQLFILIPLFAFLVSMVIPRNKEKVMSWLAVATTGIHLAGCVAFIIYWIIHGHAVLNIKHITLYKSATGFPKNFICLPIHLNGLHNT